MTEQERKENLEAITTWFHVLHSMVESGEIGDMTPAELRVYLITKSYVNFNSGNAFPSISLIAEKAKLSNQAVTTAIKLLEKRGRIAKRKEGRKNVYVIREKIECFDSEGKQESIASFDYLPSGFQKARQQIRNYLVHEKFDGRIIFIENINISMEDSFQINLQNNSKAKFDGLPEELKNSLLSIKGNMKN